MPFIATFFLMTSCNLRYSFVLNEIDGFSMGTTYQISYLLSKEHNYQYQVDSILTEINNSLSTYISHSTISKVNRADSLIVIDKYFKIVFQKAKEIYKKTNGAFNPTVMPLVNAWGFGFENKSNIDSTLIDSLLKLVNMESMMLDTGCWMLDSLFTTQHSPVGNQQISKVSKTSEILNSGILRKQNPNTMLDFSAIAKGYAVDVVADFFEDIGIENYLVEIGGEIRAKGKNEKDKWWSIGIDKPIKDTTGYREIQAIVDLRNKALATSGNYRNYYIEEGKLYAHIINPKTGYPVTHNLLSASVFADDCMTADAFATAFMVLGLEKSMAIAENDPKIEAFFIYSDEDNEFKSKYTKGLEGKIDLITN